MTLAIGLLERCAKKGARFSLDARGGVLVGNDKALDPGEMTVLRRHGREIMVVLRRLREQIVADSAGELAVLEAAAIVRNYALTV